MQMIREDILNLRRAWKDDTDVTVFCDFPCKPCYKQLTCNKCSLLMVLCEVDKQTQAKFILWTPNFLCQLLVPKIDWTSAAILGGGGPCTI